MLLKNPKAILFDFDGVIIESANIKTEAFYELYLPYGKFIAENAMNYHIKHQGVSRYKKFEEIHKLFLEKSCSETEKTTLSSKFSQIVLNKILKCKFVDGVIDFLSALQDKNIPSFLLSATPHDELISICKKRDITKYFSEIYGFPNEKPVTGKKILDKLSIDPSNAVFIGDSISDLKAATIINTNFIGRITDIKTNPFDTNVPTIKTFAEIICT